MIAKATLRLAASLAVFFVVPAAHAVSPQSVTGIESPNERDGGSGLAALSQRTPMPVPGIVGSAERDGAMDAQMQQQLSKLPSIFRTPTVTFDEPNERELAR